MNGTASCNAIVTEFMPDALDGWDWFVDDVVRWLDDELPFESLTGSAYRIGAITARLHSALADLQPSTSICQRLLIRLWPT